MEVVSKSKVIGDNIITLFHYTSGKEKMFVQVQKMDLLSEKFSLDIFGHDCVEIPGLYEIGDFYVLESGLLVGFGMVIHDDMEDPEVSLVKFTIDINKPDFTYSELVPVISGVEFLEFKFMEKLSKEDYVVVFTTGAIDPSGCGTFISHFKGVERQSTDLIDEGELDLTFYDMSQTKEGLCTIYMRDDNDPPKTHTHLLDNVDTVQDLDEELFEDVVNLLED